MTGPIVFLAVFVGDFLTKAYLASSSGWTFHEAGTPRDIVNGWATAAVFVVATRFFPWCIPLWAIVGGAIGNMAWTTFAGGAPNPFIADAQAFNLADVALLIGLVLLPVTFAMRAITTIRKENDNGNTRSIRRHHR